jgi:hypothetical protein
VHHHGIDLDVKANWETKVFAELSTGSMSGGLRLVNRLRICDTYNESKNLDILTSPVVDRWSVGK